MAGELDFYTGRYSGQEIDDNIDSARKVPSGIVIVANGGGGGGGGGGTSIEAKPSYTGDAYTVEGGAGGDGAPGCVIIYY